MIFLYESSRVFRVHFRGHAFEVVLNQPDITIKGAVLCHQFKTIDFKSRGLQFADTAPGEILNQSLAKVRSLLK